MTKHRYSFYTRSIREIDESVNAVGVEAFLRLEYGTLDHLSREDVAREIELAKQAVGEEPGALRLFARSQSDAMLEDFDNFQSEFLRGGAK